MQPITHDADKELEIFVLSRLSEMVHRVIGTSEKVSDQTGLQLPIDDHEAAGGNLEANTLKNHVRIYQITMGDEKDLGDASLAACISRLVKKGYISLEPNVPSSGKIEPRQFFTLKIVLSDKYLKNEGKWANRTLEALIAWLDNQIKNIQEETASLDVHQPTSGEAYRRIIGQASFHADQFELVKSEHWLKIKAIDTQSVYGQVEYLTAIRDLATGQRKKTLKGRGNGKTGQKTRGRPRHEDIAKDRRIWRARQANRNGSLHDLARQFDLTLPEIRRALDRQRKRPSE